MTKTVDEKHKEGLCTVISCDNIGIIRTTLEHKGLFFIECLCKEHDAQYRKESEYGGTKPEIDINVLEHMKINYGVECPGNCENCYLDAYVVGSCYLDKGGIRQ